MSKSLQNYEILKSNERGFADHGWLKSKHSFSFSSYYNPRQLGFSTLLVINEDKVASNRGFGTHPHKNMEIFSYVLSGSLAHKDSMNNGTIIKPGDVQLMSAGTGVLHSEFNPSLNEEVHFLQIWISPNVQGSQPSYQQRNFPSELKKGKLKLIISPTGEKDSLIIKQNAKVYAGMFDGNEKDYIKQDLSRSYYVHVVKGKIDINDVSLEAGDAIKIHSYLLDSDKEENLEILFHNGKNAEILVFDLNPTY